MKYLVSFDVYTFPFWSGAKERVKGLTYEQLGELGQKIEDTFYDIDPSDDDINDYVWFDCDDFFEEKEKERNEDNKD